MARSTQSGGKESTNAVEEHNEKGDRLRTARIIDAVVGIRKRRLSIGVALGCSKWRAQIVPELAGIRPLAAGGI